MQEARQYYGIGKRDAYAELCALIRVAGFQRGAVTIAQELQKAEPDHPHARAVVERFEKQLHDRRTKQEAEDDRAAKAREHLAGLERRIRELTRIIWFNDLVDPWTRDRQKFWAEQGEKLATAHDIPVPSIPQPHERLWCVAQDMSGLVHLLLVDLRAVPPHGLRPLPALQKDILPLSWKSIETWKRWSTFMPFFNSPGKAWNAAEIALKEQNLEQLGQKLGL